MYLRHLGRWGFFGPCFDEPGGGGGGGVAEDLKKAQFDRDSANARAQKLQEELDAVRKKLPSDEQQKEYTELKTAQAKLEEDRKRAEGKFDELKADLLKKHTDEVTTRDGRIKDLETLIADREIDLAFANAVVDKVPLFGGEDALTIFPADIAAKALREHVIVDYVDINGRKVPTVYVKNPATGKPILGSDGNPAPFASAMKECIGLLPSKDRILRGSGGKTGSGSSGGGGGTSEKTDVTNLSADELRNSPEKRQALHAHLEGAGSIVSGRAFSRPAK